MSTVEQRIEAAEKELKAAKEQLRQEQTPEIVKGKFYVALQSSNTKKVKTGDVVETTDSSRGLPDVNVWREGEVVIGASIHAYKLREATPDEIEKATTKPEKPFPKLMRVIDNGLASNPGNIVWMTRGKDRKGEGPVVHAVESSSVSVGYRCEGWHLEFFEDYEPDTPA